MSEYDDKIKAKLEYLRGEIRAERISYSEIAELEGLADEIDPFDVELLEWAGVSEQDAIKRQQAVIDAERYPTHNEEE